MPAAPPERRAEPAEPATLVDPADLPQTGPVPAVEPDLPAPERVTPPATADGAGELTLERLVGCWPDVLDSVRASNAMLGAVVDVANPVELAGDRLVLAFGQDAAFLRQKAEERATRSALADAVRAVTGHVLTFSYELREGQGSPQPQPLSEDELVGLLKDEFDAEELSGNEEEEAG